MTAAVLVPVKAFGLAKARLATHLSPSERRHLARRLAAGVLEAVHRTPAETAVYVACDDDEVAEWAPTVGAEVIWGPGLGLNGAIDAGVEALERAGHPRVAVVHADLACPDALPALLETELHLGRAHRSATSTLDNTPTDPAGTSIVLVPDRHRDGTNVVIRPSALRFPASYGAGSFRRHLHLALARRGPLVPTVAVRPDPRLGLDIDTVADLAHPLAGVWAADLDRSESAHHMSSGGRRR